MNPDRTEPLVGGAGLDGAAEGTEAPDGAGLRLDVGREAALARAAAIVRGAWRSFDRFRPGQPAIDDRVRELLNVGLPEAPTPVLDALNDVSRILDESIAQPRPRYFAFIGSSGLEIGVIADLLAASYDLNLAVDAAAATAVEAQAGRWVAAFVGYPADCAAAFTSGGTVSNISALAAAREHALPRVRAEGMAGVRAAVYCSRDAHYSIVRAVEMLGLGANSLRSLPVDSRRRMVPEALAEAIDADLRAGIVPVAVVATAGTTLTGAVDPIDTIADICSERGVWLHVDGAYGLPAASVSTHAPLFVGVSRADSICVDAHKWLYVPKPCSVCIVRRPGDLIRTFGHDPHYLPRDRAQQHAVDMTLEYSRPLRALKLWLALRTHGAAAFRAAIAGNLRQAQLFHNEVTRYEDLEAFDEPQLSVVPFRHVPAGVRDLDSHNRRLALLIQKDGRAWVASAVIDGRVYLRPSFVNFRSTDTDVLSLIDIARELGARLAHTGTLRRG